MSFAGGSTLMTAPAARYTNNRATESSFTRSCRAICDGFALLILLSLFLLVLPLVVLSAGFYLLLVPEPIDDQRRLQAKR